MRIRPALLLPLLLAATARPAPLQAQHCFRGRPLPACSRFWIVETGMAARVNRLDPRLSGSDYLASFEAGLLRNRGEKMALGGTVFLGLGDQVTASTGILLGVKPRLRRWLSPTLSLDLSPGAFVVAHGDVNRTSFGLTGHLGINLGDYLGITAQALLGRTPAPLPERGPTRLGLYLGGKLGSYPGVVSAIVAPLVALLVAATVRED